MGSALGALCCASVLNGLAFDPCRGAIFLIAACNRNQDKILWCGTFQMHDTSKFAGMAKKHWRRQLISAVPCCSISSLYRRSEAKYKYYCDKIWSDVLHVVFGLILKYPSFDCVNLHQRAKKTGTCAISLCVESQLVRSLGNLKREGEREGRLLDVQLGVWPGSHKKA